MRLREIHKILQDNLRSLNSIRFAQEQNQLVVIDYPRAYQSLRNLKSIGIFESDISTLLSTDPFQYNETSKIYVTSEKYSMVNTVIDRIKSEGSLLLKILGGLIKPQAENTFSFKLYDFDDLKEYRKFCDDLQSKILDPVNRLNLKTQLGELEEGSKWMSIFAGSALAFSLITSVIRQTYDIVIHDHDKARAAENLVSSLELDSEIQKKLLDAIEKRHEALFLEGTQRVLSDIAQDENLTEEERQVLIRMKESDLREYENSIRASMATLSEHLEKGLEVYHALDRQEEERYRLPDFSKLLENVEAPKKIE